MKFRRIKLGSPGLWLMLTLSALLAMAGCNYVKDGATAFQIPEKTPEYTRGELRPPKNELSDQRIIKMKWYDTNTFITTATLTPGVYKFTARNYEGGHYSADVQVDGKENFYIMPPRKSRAEAPEEITGPEVRGRITTMVAGRPARNLSVLFIGKEVVMRTAQADAQGNFKTNAPEAGIWRIEIHALGQPPASYSREPEAIQGTVDLGAVALR